MLEQRQHICEVKAVNTVVRSSFGPLSVHFTIFANRTGCRINIQKFDPVRFGLVFSIRDIHVGLVEIISSPSAKRLLPVDSVEVANSMYFSRSSYLSFAVVKEDVHHSNINVL